MAIDNLRKGSYAGKAGHTGWIGNSMSRKREPLHKGIGCFNTADIIHTTFSTMVISSGFSAKIHNGYGPLPHYFVVFSHKNSQKKCVTTAWETGTPSLSDSGSYSYTQTVNQKFGIPNNSTITRKRWF